MKYRRLSRQFIFLLVILICGILVLLSWANYQYSYQNLPGSNFLVQWVGTRDLLTSEISPYSEQTLQKTQHLANPALPVSNKIYLKYDSPLYSIALFWPFALISKYYLAQSIWMTFLEVGLISLSIFSLSLVKWKPNRITLLIFLLFSIFWFHSFQSLITGNEIILVGLSLVGGTLALMKNGDELAGVLFAFTTISIPSVLIVDIYLLYWCISRRRWKVIGWFFLTLLLLCIAVTLFVPDWLFQNLIAVFRPLDLSIPNNPATAFAVWFPASGQRIGWAVSILVGLILLLEWRISLKTGEGGFLWTFCLTLAISPLIGLPVNAGNYVLLIPPLALILSKWDNRWGKKGKIVLSTILLLLFLGIWTLFLHDYQIDTINQRYASLLLPAPILMIVMLYWFRWWIMRESTILSELS